MFKEILERKKLEEKVESLEKKLESKESSLLDLKRRLEALLENPSLESYFKEIEEEKAEFIQNWEKILQEKDKELEELIEKSTEMRTQMFQSKKAINNNSSPNIQSHFLTPPKDITGSGVEVRKRRNSFGGHRQRSSSDPNDLYSIVHELEKKATNLEHEMGQLELERGKLKQIIRRAKDRVKIMKTTATELKFSEAEFEREMKKIRLEEVKKYNLLEEQSVINFIFHPRKLKVNPSRRLSSSWGDKTLSKIKQLAEKSICEDCHHSLKHMVGKKHICGMCRRHFCDSCFFAEFKVSTIDGVCNKCLG